MSSIELEPPELALVTLAKSINEGAENHATKLQWFEKINAMAARRREPGQSQDLAFAKFIATENGRQLFAAMKSANGPDHAPTEPEPVAVIKLDSAFAKLQILAKDFQKDDPTLTDAKAFAKVFTDPRNRELAEAAKRENAFG